MTTNISPATRVRSNALAAHTANDEAIAALESQHVELLAGEDAARAALAGGDSSEAILTALTTNAAKAATLVPAIDKLQAQRHQLVHAVNLATGELWAERVEALAPEGTYVALEAIRSELADTIRGAVEAARTKADVLIAQAGELISEGRELAQFRALPRGAEYSPTSGIKINGRTFAAASTADLAELVGRALDAEHATYVRTETRARTAEQDRARAAEVAAVDAEYTAAVLALTSTPAR